MKDRIRSITSILRKKAEGLRDKEESGSADVELINALSQPTIDSLTTPAFDLSEAYILKLIQELEVQKLR